MATDGAYGEAIGGAAEGPGSRWLTEHKQCVAAPVTPNAAAGAP